MTLIVGQTGTLSLSRIKGTPILSNSNAGIVSATLTDRKISVIANSAGVATLSISDDSGTKSSQITVQQPMTLAPTSLSLTVNQSAELTVNNASGKIKVKISNRDIANVTLSGNRITVTGRKPGTASLQVSDGKTRIEAQVNVTSTTTPPPAGATPNGRLLASNCFQCHGTNGSGGFDRIRGSGELLKEMLEFASGKEDSDGIMAAHAMGYTDAQLKAIADYLATQ